MWRTGGKAGCSIPPNILDDWRSRKEREGYPGTSLTYSGSIGVWLRPRGHNELPNAEEIIKLIRLHSDGINVLLIVCDRCVYEVKCSIYAVWRYSHYSPWRKISYRSELGELLAYYGQVVDGYRREAANHGVQVRAHQYGNTCHVECTAIEQCS